MKRIGKLIRASDHETEQLNYQQGLQAMWVDRWMLLGANGKADWLQRHGTPPPLICPLVGPPLLRAVRRLLDGYPDIAYGALRQRIRAAF